MWRALGLTVFQVAEGDFCPTPRPRVTAQRVTAGHRAGTTQRVTTTTVVA